MGSSVDVSVVRVRCDGEDMQKRNTNIICNRAPSSPSLLLPDSPPVAADTPKYPAAGI